MGEILRNLGSFRGLIPLLLGHRKARFIVAVYLCSSLSYIYVCIRVAYEPSFEYVMRWCIGKWDASSPEIFILIAYSNSSALVTPCGESCLRQRWLIWWLAAWGHQALTWTDVDILLVRICGIHKWKISLLKIYHWYEYVNYYLKNKRHLPGGSELLTNVRSNYRYNALVLQHMDDI